MKQIIQCNIVLDGLEIVALEEVYRKSEDSPIYGFNEWLGCKVRETSIKELLNRGGTL